MSSWKSVRTLFLSTFFTLALISTARALEQDHTWFLSGTLNIGVDNEIFIAVANDTAFSAAVVEVHYDTTLLEIGTASPSLLSEGTHFVRVGERMDSIAVMGSKPAGTEGVARFTLYSTAQTDPYYHIVAGTGDIIKLIIKVKPGVESGATTLELTKTNSGVSLTTLRLDITAPEGNVAPSWSVSAVTLNLTEGSLFTHVFDAPVDRDPGDQYELSAPNLPGDAQFDPLSRTFTWTPGFEDAGTYEFVITATDLEGTKGYLTVTLIVENVNQPPVLTVAQESYELNQGEPLSFSIKAEDPDGQRVTVTAAGLPAGATFVYPVFNWLSAKAGQHTVTFTAEDPDGLTDSKSVAITVTAVNRAPDFAAVNDTTIETGTALVLTLSATDPDGDQPLTYSVVLASETDNILTRGATLSGNVFSWTPAATDIGPNIVLFKVEDPGGLSDELSVKITVTVTGRNVTAPVAFADFGEIVIEEGAEYSLQLPLLDPSLENLTYWALGLPEGSSLDSETGLFAWTPTLLQSGTYTVVFGVSDGSFQDEAEVVITVAETAVLPDLHSIDGLPIGNLIVNEGELLSVVLEAEDASGEQVTFSAAGLPAGAQLFTLGLLTYEPGYDAAGDYTVTFTVTDASGNIDEETITLTVVDVNREPVLAALDNRAVQENQRLSFTVTATDPDGDDFTLGSGDLPTGASFNPATGVFEWTPGQQQSGNYEILFTADDGLAGGVDSLVVIVSVGNVNRPPKIDPVGNQVVAEGQSLSFQVTASDPDLDDALTISATGLPVTPQVSQSGTNPAYATVTLTAGYLHQGTYNVVVTATDNDTQPLSSYVKFTLEVIDVDVAPAFTGVLAGTGPYEVTVKENEPLQITVTAVDPGGDRLSFSATGLPQNARLDLSGTAADANLIFTPSFTQSGLHLFDILVTDGSKVVTKRVSVTVADVNRPPRVPPIEDQSVIEGNIITFAVEATDPDGDSFELFTAGRVPFLTEGVPPPAWIRDGNVFVFDTDLVPEEEQIKSAVFLFWAVDARDSVSDTVQVEIAVVRSDSLQVTDLSSGLVQLAATTTLTTPGMGLSINLDNNSGNTVSGPLDYFEKSGFINPLSGSTILAGAGEKPVKSKGVYNFTYLAGELTSQFYGIRRGWGVDLTAFAAATGADSLVPGLGATVTISYLQEDLPTEIPNFTEERLKVFGYDGLASTWVMLDSASVDTATNVATFKLTNPNFIDYTVGAVLDVVAPLITDLKVKAGNFTVSSTGVDTLYNLEGAYEFRVNITDDEIVNPTDAKIFYALGAGSFTEKPLIRSGPNLFTAAIEEGTLASGTVIRYYVLAMDEMNSVTSPQGAPESYYELVLLEYTGQPGDLDGNTKVDIFDLLELLKVLGGSVQPGVFSDVDQDGKTDIFDLLELLKILSG